MSDFSNTALGRGISEGKTEAVSKGLTRGAPLKMVSSKDPKGFSGEGWHPEEAVTREQALKMFTLWPAYAAFEEKLRGSIEPGKLADFVALTDDVFAIDPAKIADTKVWLTVFDGKVIDGAPPSPYNELPNGLVLRQ